MFFVFSLFGPGGSLFYYCFTIRFHLTFKPNVSTHIRHAATLSGMWKNSSVCVCVCVLPPVSEQKVISQPSPDENASSISLNTLPRKHTTRPTGQSTCSCRYEVVG